MTRQRSPEPLDHAAADQMSSAFDPFAASGIACDWLGKAECGYGE